MPLTNVAKLGTWTEDFKTYVQIIRLQEDKRQILHQIHPMENFKLELLLSFYEFNYHCQSVFKYLVLFKNLLFLNNCPPVLYSSFCMRIYLV